MPTKENRYARIDSGLLGSTAFQNSFRSTSYAVDSWQSLWTYVNISHQTALYLVGRAIHRHTTYSVLMSALCWHAGHKGQQQRQGGPPRHPLVLHCIHPVWRLF